MENWYEVSTVISELCTFLDKILSSMWSVMGSAGFPLTFYRALLVYPALLVALSAGFGRRKSTDGNHWRNATQLALKSVSSIHALLTSYLAAKDVFAPKWTSWVLGAIFVEAPAFNTDVVACHMQRRLNLITTRSSEANSVVGLEAGYLIQDTIVSAVRALLPNKGNSILTCSLYI